MKSGHFFFKVNEETHLDSSHVRATNGDNEDFRGASRDFKTGKKPVKKLPKKTIRVTLKGNSSLLQQLYTALFCFRLYIVLYTVYYSSHWG